MHRNGAIQIPSMNVKRRVRIRFFGILLPRLHRHPERREHRDHRDERMLRDRLHERGLREPERDAERGDDDADEDEAVGAPNERRTLLAGANEGPGKRDTHVGESSVEGLWKYTP